MRSTLSFVAVLGILAFFAGNAAASPITITETLPGVSGYLDGTMFNDETVTLKFYGDSSQVNHTVSLYTLPVTSATVYVPGIDVLPDSITDSLVAFVSQSNARAGVADSSTTHDLFDAVDSTNSDYSTYSFQTPIGPDAGTATGGDGGALMAGTSRGSLTVDNFSVTGSYQTVIVPEPGMAVGTLLMFGLFMCCRRRVLTSMS